MQIIRISELRFFFFFGTDVKLLKFVQMAQSVGIKRQNKNDCRYPMLRVFYTKPLFGGTHTTKHIIGRNEARGCLSDELHIYIYINMLLWTIAEGKCYATSVTMNVTGQYRLIRVGGLQPVFMWIHSFERDVCIKWWLFV